MMHWRLLLRSLVLADVFVLLALGIGDVDWMLISLSSELRSPYSHW
jgi:hypothetical protein